MTIHHNEVGREFTTGPDHEQAKLAYVLPAAGLIDFVHTFVPEQQRGQGVGKALAEAGLAYARTQQWRVRTSCPFMAEYVHRHAARFADLVA